MFDAALLFRMQLRPVRTSIELGKANWRLPEEATLPEFGSSLSGQSNFAKLRLAVSDKALFLSAEFGENANCRGAESRVWKTVTVCTSGSTPAIREACIGPRVLSSVRIRADGSRSKNERPFASWAPINRARENSQPPSEKLLDVQATMRGADYDLSAGISWQALTGFDAQDFPVIGFYAAIIDRELGWQSLGLAPPYPVAEDPSLWLELSL